ncbi:MAG: hypothetical protein DIU68_009200 [Chloroflexota bacterium]|nr:MAG: hypothetical protein DIU68_06730 [Chloroflexota bacterium]
MTGHDMWRDAALAVARHLPPSAAMLRLIDVGGRAGATLSELRDDLAIDVVPLNVGQQRLEPESADAVVALGTRPEAALLAGALSVLRPGGRLMIVDPDGRPDQDAVDILQDAGFTRILVESAHPAGGVLLRAEKPHVTDDTLARIAQVAGRDVASLDLAAYKGPYVHLLIRQHPNKPAWARQPGETVTWEAAAIQTDEGPVLLAFSALPRAVAFMQPAVLAGRIHGVNKVAKFSRATAAQWPERVLLNPPVEVLAQGELVFISIDPATAEAPDE